MKYKWLNKNKSKKLIIFFNGWGMDDYIVSGLKPDGYDVLMFYDYTDLSLNMDIKELDSYSEKHLVAWSMGVMTAGFFDFEYISATALCGTPYPIDNNFGIPHKIYELTIKGYNIDSAKKFMNRMFLTNPVSDKYSNRSLDSCQKELISLNNYQTKSDYRPINYTRVIAGDKDIIIPTKNQLNYWSSVNIKPEIIHSGHCPFNIYKKWSELI